LRTIEQIVVRQGIDSGCGKANLEVALKAIVYTRYGSPDVLQLKDVEEPVPLDDEVLVEADAASVNAYDWHFLTADVFLIRLMGRGLPEEESP
jgi:hypothetical protein